MKRVQFPEEVFCTQIWPPWRHVKTIYSWRCSRSFSREQQNFYFYSGLKEVQTFAKFWPYLKTYFLQEDSVYKFFSITAARRHSTNQSLVSSARRLWLPLPGDMVVHMRKVLAIAAETAELVPWTGLKLALNLCTAALSPQARASVVREEKLFECRGPRNA